MIRFFLVWILFLFSACSGVCCETGEAVAAQYDFDWGEWRSAGAFGLEDSIYWARLREGEIEVTVIADGKARGSVTNRSAVVDGTISAITSDRGSALYFVARTRGGGPTQVFRYNPASGDFKEFWTGEISGVIIDAHFLSESNLLVIVTQNTCYLIDGFGTVTDFGPVTHAEAPWFYSASAASSRGLALNLDNDLVVYEPGEEPEILEDRDRANRVSEMASLGDQWIVLHVGDPARRLLRLGPEINQAIAAPPDDYLRVRSYGDTVVLWSHDSDELLFIGPNGERNVEVELDEETRRSDLNWYLIKGYSSQMVFLIREGAYWAVRIPEIPLSKSSSSTP